jgi:hypothetical protein
VLGGQEKQPRTGLYRSEFPSSSGTLFGRRGVVFASMVPMNLYRLAAAWLIVCVVVTGGGIQARQIASERRLNPAIGAPILNRYESIRGAQDWLNPYLTVCPQGVLLDVRSVKRVNDTVSPKCFAKSFLTSQ